MDKKYKIVSDSSGDIHSLGDFPFASAPLKIIAGEREWIDNAELNIEEMVEYLLKYNGKSGSACPSPADWTEAFEDYENVFCITISSNLSGSYNAALTAKGIYESEHPERKVFLVDTLSAGPEEGLIVEKLGDLIASGLSYEEVCQEITAYLSRSGLLFMLESLKNMANNGRVSHAVAKITGFLGIRIVGRASDHGTLEPTDKCRNQAKSLDTIVKRLQERGFMDGKIKIDHCLNEEGAKALKEKILAHFPDAKVAIQETRGICSFYAERGGLMVGYALD